MIRNWDKEYTFISTMLTIVWESAWGRRMEATKEKNLIRLILFMIVGFELKRGESYENSFDLFCNVPSQDDNQSQMLINEN